MANSQYRRPGLDGKMKIIVAAWLAAMLGMLGSMVALLVLGYPQALAMIFLMVIVTAALALRLER